MAITYLVIGSSMLCKSNPVVYIDRYLGRLGNQLFQFCLGKILSKELGIPFITPPIKGFPETYLHQNEKTPRNGKSRELKGHVIKFNNILSKNTRRNIRLNGFFIRYEYYKNYTDDIKYWLRFDEEIGQQDPNDIVLHIRLNNPEGYLPFEYYEDALATTTFNNVYICTNAPEDPFIVKFEKYNPIIIKRPYLDDFKFITSFNKIAIAQSSFSWWAAFLSKAEEIYMPLPNKGYMSSERPDCQWKVEEERYHYIPCNY